jgi:GT2 family glycosyltransferase
MMPPRVSVLLTTHNGAGTIRSSIAGILAQSFADFELVVVDDASTDATPEILAGISDRRMRVLRPDRNLGVVGARNFGFAACRGEYVAAHDHDDLSRPGRLARQVALLDREPKTVLVATEVELESDGRLTRSGHVSAGDALAMRWLLLVDNPLTWSSVMVRADTIHQSGQFVRPEYELADDFDLYHRLLRLGDIVRLPEPLTIYRWHGSNTAERGRARLQSNAVKILREAYAGWLGPEAEDAAWLVVRHLSHRQPISDRRTLERLGFFLERLVRGFCTGRSSSESSRVAALAGEVWWKAVRAAMRKGHPTFGGVFQQPATLARAYTPGSADRLVSAAFGAGRALLSAVRAPRT